tara:strand:+ start:117 stop:227 length:111 start_codon:yes stop_codon:yes gene_type:complete
MAIELKFTTAKVVSIESELIIFSIISPFENEVLCAE